MKGLSKRQIVTFEQLSYSSMLTMNALVELLAERKLLTKDEMLERFKQLRG
jgi:hypothetical protein